MWFSIWISWTGVKPWGTGETPIAIGAVLAVAAGRQAASLLYGVPPLDPLLLGATIGLLALIALIASIARRRARHGSSP